MTAAQARLLDEEQSEIDSWSSYMLASAERPSGLEFRYIGKQKHKTFTVI